MRKLILVFVALALCLYGNAQSCPPNLNFGYGNFTNWQCYTGSTKDSFGVNIITVNPSAPIATRHRLYPKQTPSLLDTFGLFPITPANSSSYVLKLGNFLSGAQAERARYTLRIPSSTTNYSMVYQYAVVLEDPNHDEPEQPRMTVRFIDSATKKVIKCPTVEFVVGPKLPGFLPSTRYFIQKDTVWYKPWSQVYVNLAPYAGKTVYLEVTTADCTPTAHFGYGYFDIIYCGVNDIVPNYFCTTPPSVKVTAQPGYQTYNWWDSTFSTKIDTGFSINIVPPPPDNSYLNLELIPYNGYGCRDTIKTRRIAIKNIYANAGPDRVICDSGAVDIGMPPIPLITYTWLPNLYISNTTIANPTVFTPVSRDYYVTIYDSTTYCTSKDTVTVNIMPKPKFSFTIADSIQCSNEAFIFNATLNPSNSTTYWDFGDGTSSSAPNPVHYFAANGTNTVKLIVTSPNTCYDSTQQQVFVFTKPKTNFAVNDSNQCFRDNLYAFSNTYSSTNGQVHYVWDFGDNSSFAIQPNPQHHYNQSGNYTLILKVIDSLNCVDSVVVPINVYHQPHTAFSINDSAQCLNTNNFIFTNNTSIAGGTMNYGWDFGDGVGTSTNTNPSYVYLNYGTKTVRLIANSNNGCADTTLIPVIVYPKPNIAFNIDTTSLCLTNNIFNLSNISSIPVDSIVQHIWSFGDGITSTIKSPNHSYAFSGLFNVQLAGISNHGCRDSIQHPITVFAIPQVNLSTIGPSNICIGDTGKIQVTASAGSGTISSYNWFYNGLPLTSASGTFHQTLNAGLYNVLVTNSNKCVKLSDTLPITFNPYPVGNLVQPNTHNICEGSKVALNATGGNSYQWFFNGNSIPGATTSQYNADSPGVYTVKLISPFNCVTNLTDTVHLKYYAKPRAVFTHDKYCVKTTIHFSNLSTFTNGDSIKYNWNFGDGYSSNAFSPAHYYSVANNYPVTLKASSTVCSYLFDTNRQVITIINPVPNVRYPAVNALKNLPQPLYVRDSGVAYVWKPALGLNFNNIYNPVFTYNRPEEYQISINLPSGCTVVDTLLVRMFDDGDIYVPKAFTPNRDGHNDNLYPLIVGTTQLKVFRIFNRWGQLMFETTMPKFGWDGIFNGKPQPMDTYTWTCEAISYDGRLIQRSGNSVLIR